jgi:hypothetical protein
VLCLTLHQQQARNIDAVSLEMDLIHQRLIDASIQSETRLQCDGRIIVRNVSINEWTVPWIF